MNKKLIVLALAALPAAAMADVTIYGTLTGGIEHDSQTGAASQNRVDDYTSKIGFKGTEDLGNGLKTVWQVENRVNIDGTGSNGVGSRATFVGLDGGNLGEIRLGYMNTTLNDQYAVDQWSYNNGANGLTFWSDDSGTRLKNQVRYDSATFAGFSGELAYGFGENATLGTSASNVQEFALNYSYNDALSAHYAGQRETNPATAQGANQTATKQLLEVDYSANNLFLSGAYQIATGYQWSDTWASAAAVTSQLKTKELALSVGYTIGAFTPKFSYAKGWDQSNNSGSVNDSGYHQYVVGVDYALSKRTTAGVTFGDMVVGKGAADYAATQDTTLKTFSVQLAHSF